MGKTSVLLAVLAGLFISLTHSATAAPDGTPHTSAAVRSALLYGFENNSLETAAQLAPLDAPEERRTSDPWLAFDKVQHLTFSALITVGSQYTLENKLDYRESSALPLSIASSFAVGLAKELYDWHFGPRRHFSTRDMTANGAGILLAVGFILL
ncbi:MAG: hypothetical protein ACOCTG_02155 [Bacteroidota bacterium]